MKNDTAFWSGNGSDEMYQMDNAEKAILHPYVASLVHSLTPKHVLDYGCGNGVLATLIDPQVQVSLFDKKADSLQPVVDQLNLSHVSAIEKESEIPEGFFDVVVLSQVLMCIPTLVEIQELAEKLDSYLTRDGRLVIVVTHPCFLQYKYGHWHSSYAEGQPFRYLQPGEPYTVYMKRPQTPALPFTDYNWPLQTILNTFLDAGFIFKQLIEHRDMVYRPEWHANPDFPHYMFIVFNK
ncbi:MAG: methyltransferase domain-containing protein [Bacteroidetes bacterium]|nr:methyltransferase domain-containing protein [Bacteroidota bacterium]